MARVTTANGQTDYEWIEDRWYELELERVDRIEPKGTPGYEGKPRRHARISLVWRLPGTDTWLWDNFDLTVNNKTDGTPSSCKQLMCALEGRNHLHEATPWIDDETGEYGFDADAAIVTGQFLPEMKVAARGKWGKDAKGSPRFTIEKYAHPPSVGLATSTPATSPPAQPILSEDGRWRWDGSQWVPVQAPAPVQQQLV